MKAVLSQRKKAEKEWSALHISKQKSHIGTSPENFFPILINSSISIVVFTSIIRQYLHLFISVLEC